jgi:beta-glucosidase
VQYWLTINEPTVYVLKGYVEGTWPPCFKSAWGKAALVFKNLARAHVVAYRALHRSHRDIMVGFAHSAPHIVPCDSTRTRDRMAAALRDVLLNGAFFSLIGAFPSTGRRLPRSLDFIGINYYTRTIVRSSGWGMGAILGRACRLPHHRDQGPRSATGWEVYPPGFTVVLEKFARFGVPLLVTENGVATDDETIRRDFLQQHLESLAQALEKGVPIMGYLYWTLMDNFEWTLGTNARFGLAAVDFHTQQRLPRSFAKTFERMCRENRLVRHQQ